MENPITSGILHEWKKKLDDHFSEIQQQFAKENERYPKKVCENVVLKFRHRVMSHSLNLTIDCFAAKVIACLVKTDSSEKSIKSISNTVAELEIKNKLMKIVDKFPVGKKTVEECMSKSFDRDLLAKRKIRAVETRANKN